MSITSSENALYAVSENAQAESFKDAVSEIVSIKVNLKSLTTPLFRVLLSQLFLVAPDTVPGKEAEEWDTFYAVLKCSNLYMEKFNKVTADKVNVIVSENDEILNIMSEDETISLYTQEYPCTICAFQVTWEQDDSGNGLRCDSCQKWYHNSCAPPELKVSAELLKLLDKGYNSNVCVYCPKCMIDNKPVTLASVMHELKDLKTRFEKISTLAEDAKRISKTEDTRNTTLLSNIVRNTEDLKSEKHVISKSLAKLAVSADRSKLAGGEGQIQQSGRRGYEGYDPEKTVIIQGVKKKEFLVSTGAELKRQLGKLFKFRIKIQTAQKTMRGNLQYQLSTTEDAKKIIAEWDSTFLGGDTKATSPSSGKLFEGALKDVPVDIEDTVLQELISKSYAGVTCKRLKRQGSPLLTVKVTFTSEKDLQDCIEKGVYHEEEHLHLDLNEFYTGTRARVLRCHNCQGYGHVAKDCTKPTTCVKCGIEGHKHWPYKNMICNEKINCVHCKTEHQADSVECLKYKAVKDLLQKKRSQPRHNILTKSS